MRNASAFWLGLLPAAVVILSIAAASLFFRFYLRETSWQFASFFEKQNLGAIETGDVFALSSRLNALGASMRATCVTARRGGHVFFEQKTGPCARGFLRERVWVETGNQEGIRVEFTLRLPRTVELAGTAFLTLQLLLLGLLFLGVRQLEWVRSEGARRLAALAAQVAHDIRSPVAALEALLPGREERSEDSAMMRGAIDRIRAIAEDLLEKNRAGTSAAPESTDLGIAAAASVAEKRLKHPGTNLSAIVAEGIFVRVERKELSRVLSNLIENAIEAAARGVVEVRVERRAGEALLRVVDDGPGIPRERLARLGERGATFGKAGGSGLGLHHAFEAARRWGGRVVVESEEGRGTEVRLELPLQSPRAACALIDDDPLVRATWSAAARRAGVALSVYPDLAAFDAAAPAAGTRVYLDLNLSDGRSGLEAARVLSERGYREIHIATGESLEPDQRPAFIAGVCGKEPPWGFG
ncbi:MAG: hypothetical protein AUJ52_15430 [Elusimicrobia bacterium CG1_02_63_36]|nr:MAG: hypothetical protein AUJ52_15430 [Elusimicrobia bacterium CG1_02_63_36]PIP84439.1 MAG: hypothetical protein COR54_04550 [Elusimicrobia bacterium CG22_combo_CG10-13_8_21_14_all_63_91]PJA18295.1 MAG: hypothetical protein COX66_01690 [Elusimicrobia bacterium CG_4_10_14_0_2_um_filter_63_34]PJB23436.1 MAG: hypothetical protein CO113_18530 [Elusimicrobia bacterium CG_4_9_14_3_um_filter_62_55]